MACSGYDASQVATIPAGSGLFEGDAELAMLEGIRCVDGHLTILQVTSLDPLSLLEKATGSLSIDAPVPSVVPLANLRQVGSLSIEGTEAFSLSGLESLERVGDLSIGALRASSTVESSPDKGNDRLTDLSALAGAVVVDSVVVGDNDALAVVTGEPGMRLGAALAARDGTLAVGASATASAVAATPSRRARAPSRDAGPPLDPARSQAAPDPQPGAARRRSA